MSEGVGTVERKKMKLALPEGGLKLAYGGVLKEVEVAYEECGAPIGTDNVIYICHALTGDSHVAGMLPGEEKPSGWWEEMVGPGRAFDTNRFHIVCANVLGGCQGTTGPMSVNPDTGKPYGSSFPQYTFDDAVDVFRMLLHQLGVKRLAALVGGSYGGLQVVNWMTRYPDEIDKVCLIATSAHLNTQAIAFSVMSRNSITDDPKWQGGDYYLVGDGKGPRAGLAAARQLAHITYLSRELLQEKFQRNLQKNFVEAPEEERAERDRLFKTYFQIESYLDYQAMKFVRRFDANSYLHITRSMDLYDPCDRFGSLDAAFALVKSRVLVVSYENDILFPAWQSKEIAASLMRMDKRVSYCHLESGTGHDSFLTDIEHVRQDEGRAFLLDGAGQEAERLGDVRPRGLGLIVQDLPDDVEEVAATLFRGDELFHPVAEKQGADLVVVQDRGEGEDGGDFRNLFPLGLPGGAEQAGTADVDQQDDSQLALFLEDLDIRRAHACGDVPVHVADIVTILVLTDFAESHTPALEGRMVLSGEDLVRERLGLDFDLADLLEQFSRVVHYGTMTALMTFSMICSVVTFSASAS